MTEIQAGLFRGFSFSTHRVCTWTQAPGAATHARAQPWGLSSDAGGAEGKEITLKKWAVMSWVRAPSWEKFLCKTVEASEEGTCRTGRAAARGSTT